MAIANIENFTKTTYVGGLAFNFGGIVVESNGYVKFLPDEFYSGKLCLGSTGFYYKSFEFDNPYEFQLKSETYKEAVVKLLNAKKSGELG